MRTAFHVLVSAGLVAAFVALPLPLNMLAFAAWFFAVRRWAKRSPDDSGAPSVRGEWILHAALMVAITAAAVAAPGKVVDSVKARRVVLPRSESTLAELAEPIEHGLDMPRFYHVLNRVEGAERVVRFPSKEPTIGEFIAAVESQTALRHRFHHCGNGYTILWGGDCSFGLFFR